LLKVHNFFWGSHCDYSTWPPEKPSYDTGLTDAN